jgi:hypothetical protein
MTLTRAARIWLTALACALATTVFYRQFFLSRFQLVSGDLADARSFIVILEHWRAVVLGLAPLASPNFFAPFRGTLGYGEAMSLFAPPYLLFSGLGADRYLAYQFSLILAKAAGFLALYALCRRPLRLSCLASLTAAALFTLSNPAYLASREHCQLTAAAFLPVCAWLFYRSYDRRSLVSLSAACVLSGLLFTTCFYIAWLTGLFLLLAAAWLFLLHLPASLTWPGKLRHLLTRSNLLPLAIALLSLALPVALCLAIYLPALARTGGRTFGEAFVYLRTFPELLDPGPNNLLWGALAARLFDPLRPRTGEFGYGLTPLLALTFLDSAFANRKNKPLAALSLAAASLSLLTVRYGRYAPWWFAFHFLPGAVALRVPGRAILVSLFPIALLAGAALDSLARRLPRRLALTLPALLAAALLAEQLNSINQAAISRHTEHSLIDSFPRQAPESCQVFFALDPTRTGKAAQVDAALLARRVNVPTLNGYFSFLPPNWYLITTDPSYPQQAVNYAFQLGFRHNLCEASFPTHRFLPIPIAPGAPYSGQTLRFGLEGNSQPYQSLGWSYAEHGATWTMGGDATLFLQLPAAFPATHLRFSFLAYTPAQHPSLSFSIEVNGTQLGAFTTTASAPLSTLDLPVPAALLRPLTRIDFLTPNAVSPTSLGLSDDLRRLGLALRTLALTP